MQRIAWVAFLVPLLSARATGQSLVINEVSSSNGETIRDEDGESSDWIELYNASAFDISLAGYSVSDDRNPLKWTFPAVVVRASGHLLLFASGKDRREATAHWETVIDRGDTWRYLIPTSEPNATWRAPGFNHATWASGRTGIGYGDGDDVTQIPAGTISVYARKTFSIDDPAAVTHVFLDVDFDDAFVAFLNGVEIARANIADQGRPPRFNEVADGYTEPRMVFGDPPFHYPVPDFEGVLRAGENVLAIQLHNSDAGSSDLTLIPFLTLGMTQVPAGARGPAEVLRANFPALHTNFRIDADGEVITLSSPELDLLDAVDTGALPTDVSLGRFPDGADGFSYHVAPTPGRPNASAGYASVSGAVTFSHAAGYYAGPIELTLTTADPSGALYYTLDGSVPTEASSRYASPIGIAATTVVRARVLAAGAIPGETATHTLLIGESSTLPVLSVSTDPENFFDSETGIYVLGNDYEAAFPHFGANFWEDWERPVHLELIEADGTVGLRANAGAKVFGGWSRGHPQRSLAFFARARYGAGTFRYEIFPDKKLASFESFVVRNSGNDWQRTHFRDALMTSLLDGLSVDRQAYRPAVVYINGDYWGIMNLREKVNEHFIASNHAGVDANGIDLLERNGAIIHGDSDHYRSLLALLEQGDVSDPAVYERVKEMMDVDNFIDYQASQIYFDNTDWPGNNIKFWRPRTAGGRWRWILFDTDFGFGIWNPGNYLNNTLAFALEPAGPDWPNPPWSTSMLRRLVTNEQFVEDFVNRFATHLGTIFVGQKVVERINAMASTLEPEMPAQRARWGSSVSSWMSDVGTLRSFATRRVAAIRGHLTTRFGLGGPARVDLDVTPPGSGVVTIQGVEIPAYPWSGVYFQGVPVRIEAVPRPGYRFAGWSGLSPSEQAALTVELTAGGLEGSATFEIDCDTVGSVVINEINYNSAPGSNPGDWVELHNPTPSDIDLSGWSFRDASQDHAYSIPGGTVLPAGGYLVLCSSAAVFDAFFPQVGHRLGDLGFSLDGSGELLELSDSEGTTVDGLTYADEDPWPEEADGHGATLALKNPVLDNGYAPHWAASPGGGSPGARNADVFEDVDARCRHGAIFFLRGDCNSDGFFDISDALCILAGLFRQRTEPACVAALNANGDGRVDISDAIWALDYLFLDGTAPAEPFSRCGPATLPSDDELGCATQPVGCE